MSSVPSASPTLEAGDLPLGRDRPDADRHHHRAASGTRRHPDPRVRRTPDHHVEPARRELGSPPSPPLGLDARDPPQGRRAGSAARWASALRRTNGRRNLIVAKPPASRRERILDILLFPVHVAIILTRAVANRFGWKLPGDARKERKAQRERRRLHRARRLRREEKRERARWRPGRQGCRQRQVWLKAKSKGRKQDRGGRRWRAPPAQGPCADRGIGSGRRRTLTFDMASAGSTSVDDYIAAQPEAACGQRSGTVRAASARRYREAEEVISYKIPAYRLPQGVVIWFAGWKGTIRSTPPPSRVVSALKLGICALTRSRRARIRFPCSIRRPAKLIGRIARLRAEEVAANAKGAASGKRWTRILRARQSRFARRKRASRATGGPRKPSRNRSAEFDAETC